MGRGGQSCGGSSGGAVSKDPVLVGGQALGVAQAHLAVGPLIRLLVRVCQKRTAATSCRASRKCSDHCENSMRQARSARLCQGRLLVPMPGMVASTCFTGSVAVRWCSGQCRAGACRPGLDQGCAAAAIARTDRSTSASVVRQLDTEIRMSRWPCQVVEPIQHWPERCTASMTRSVVASSSPNRTSTWFKTTSLTTQMPSMAVSWVAKRRARTQQRSTSSAMPLRPSSRSAAYVANPRARRDDSST